jgi:hypothetical protein
MPENPATEPLAALTMTELRQLRDKVFGVPLSDREWASCGLNWSRPDSVEWLREKAKREIVV